MIKIISLIFVLVFCVFPVSAVNLIIDQDETNELKNKANSGFATEYFVVGSSNNENIQVGSNSRQGDLKLELVNIRDLVFISVENFIVNTTLNISYVNDDFLGLNVSENILTTQEITFNEVGIYNFAIEPLEGGQNVDILLETGDLSVLNIRTYERIPQGFSYAFTAIIDSVSAIASLLVFFWSFVVRLVLALMILGLVFAIVYALYRLYLFIDKSRGMFNVTRRRR